MIKQTHFSEKSSSASITSPFFYLNLLILTLIKIIIIILTCRYQYQLRIVLVHLLHVTIQLCIQSLNILLVYTFLTHYKQTLLNFTNHQILWVIRSKFIFLHIFKFNREKISVAKKQEGLPRAPLPTPLPVDATFIIITNQCTLLLKIDIVFPQRSIS